MENKIYKAGVWSAAPTPLTTNGKVDCESIKRLTEHHLRLGIQGVFLCGTSGEGPWMTADMCQAVVDTTVEAAAGRLKVTVQVKVPSQVIDLDTGKLVAKITPAKNSFTIELEGELARPLRIYPLVNK